MFDKLPNLPQTQQRFSRVKIFSGKIQINIPLSMAIKNLSSSLIHQKSFCVQINFNLKSRKHNKNTKHCIQT